MYGTGDVAGKGFKAASDLDGPTFDPDRGDRLPDPAAVERCRRYLAKRFPGLADAPVSLTRTCQYTSTADGRWIVAPHPDHDGVWIVGGGSGHGFKHGPALAEHVVRLIEGAEPPRPELGMGRRHADPGLRTRQDRPAS
jgi:glycine/D-amino acid oxidase-like deaminating enzyme